jgi:hypothetical protein
MTTTAMNGRADIADKSAGYTAQDDRDDFNIIFIHKDLDDFGLDPYSFRIYSRIVRRAGRGESFESNKHMAEGCRMSEAQVKRSLKVLTEYGLIIKEKRPGTTCLYRVAPRRNWSNPIPPNTPDSTGSSDRPIRDEEVIEDINDTNDVRLGLPELGVRSTRPNRLGLVDLLSKSNISKSNKDLERSVVKKSEEESQASPEIQATLDSRFLVNKQKDSPTNEQTNHEGQAWAPRDNDSQSWQCPEPKLRREFMKWLYQTAPSIQTARHAANWCNKYPQDADLAWDDFMASRDRVSAQVASFTVWESDRHEMLVRQYKSACVSGAVFLDNFTAQNAAWLQWVQGNHPEWLEDVA